MHRQIYSLNLNRGLKFEWGVTCVFQRTCGVWISCKIYNISLRTALSNYFLHHIQHGHFSHWNPYWRSRKCMAVCSIIHDRGSSVEVYHFKCSIGVNFTQHQDSQKDFKGSWPIPKRIPIRMQSPVVLSTDTGEALWKEVIRIWRYQCILGQNPTGTPTRSSLAPRLIILSNSANIKFII